MLKKSECNQEMEQSKITYQPTESWGSGIITQRKTYIH